MKAKLLARTGPLKGREFFLEAEATVGRGADNSIRLESKPVSQRHARIYFDTERKAYFLEDLGSLNGTELDGTRVTKPQKLEALHVLRFGGVAEFLFVEIDREAPAKVATAEASKPADGGKTVVDREIPDLPASLQNTDAADESPAALEGTRIETLPVGLPSNLAARGDATAGEDDAAEPPPFGLAVFLPEGTRRFEIHQGENVVGRSLAAAVRVPYRELSRRHAVLVVSGAQVTVRDLGSRNHTYLEGKKVKGEMEVPLDGLLRFGQIEARLVRRDLGGDTMAPWDTDDGKE